MISSFIAQMLRQKSDHKFERHSRQDKKAFMTDRSTAAKGTKEYLDMIRASVRMVGGD
jgi:hypothetical protein